MPSAEETAAAVGVGGLRHDPVHHRRREGDLGFDPFGEIARSQGGELRHDPPDGMAVGGEIVAGQHGEGGSARNPPARQRGHEESDRRARRVRILQVMNDVGMTLVEIAGLRRVAVALLGDRQRDDARGRIGHARDQRGGFLGGDFACENRADDPVLGARAGTNGDRVEAILRGEGIARIRTAQAGADDSPIRGATGEEVVDHDRLVRPVERADSEMNDARRDARAVIGRTADLAGKPVEAGVREAKIAVFWA